MVYFLYNIGFVYSSAIFAYILFANHISAEEAITADDDAQRWSSLSVILNFRTFPQSLHTMFQVMIIGNWSSVMSAAAIKQKNLSFFFFYTFRILIAIVCMPILLSFVIQTYVTQKKKLETQERNQERQRKEMSMHKTNSTQFKWFEIFDMTSTDIDGDCVS